VSEALPCGAIARGAAASGTTVGSFSGGEAEAAETEPVGGRDGPVEDLVQADDGALAGLVDGHPRGPLPRPERAAQADEPATLEDLAMLRVERDLGAH
jgi:hypothetical protein